MVNKKVEQLAQKHASTALPPVPMNMYGIDPRLTAESLSHLIQTGTNPVMDRLLLDERERRRKKKEYSLSDRLAKGIAASGLTGLALYGVSRGMQEDE